MSFKYQKILKNYKKFYTNNQFYTTESILSNNHSTFQVYVKKPFLNLLKLYVGNDVFLSKYLLEK